MQRGQPGHQPGPGDQRADQHGDAAGQANQVAHPEQGQGQAEIVAADGVAAADAKVVDEVAGKHLGGGDQVEQRRHYRTNHHRQQTGLAPFR